MFLSPRVDSITKDTRERMSGSLNNSRNEESICSYVDEASETSFSLSSGRQRGGTLTTVSARKKETFTVKIRDESSLQLKN